MYTPESLSITEIQVKSAKSSINIVSMGNDEFLIEIDTRAPIKLSKDTLEAIYYGCNKLQSLQRFNNEPSESK